MTSVTVSNADLSGIFRKGDAIRMTPDRDRMGTKVVVAVFATYMTTRDVRWYDHPRWWARSVVSWVRRAIVRLFQRATP